MGVMDILKSGYEAVSGSGGSSDSKESLPGGIWRKIMETIGLKNPEIADDALKAKEKAESMRNGFMGEFSKALFLRQFPALAAATDLSAQLSGNKAKEVVSWQNEFETITAIMMLMPKSWKHWLTDFFANSNWFRSLITFWPGLDGVDLGKTPLIGEYLAKIPGGVSESGNIRQKILNDKDPDAVIAALRVMHQDIFVLGKVSADVLVRAMSGDTKGMMELLGGGAAAAAATAVLGMASGPEGVSPTTAAVGLSGAAAIEAVKAAATGTGSLKDKKLLDLQKAHPELKATTMQTKVMELLKHLNVLENAVLIKGDWAGNNDEVTIGYTYQGGVYFLTFDEDITSSDINVRNAQGLQIYETTDMFGLDAEDNAADIVKAMQKNPSEKPAAPAAATPPSPAPTPATAAAPAPTPTPPPTLATVQTPTPTPANENNAPEQKAA